MLSRAIVLLVTVLFAGAPGALAFAQSPPQGSSATPPGTETLELEAIQGVEANFQPYIFWAYALACALLLAFTFYAISQARHLSHRITYLEERLERAQRSEERGG